MHRPELHVLTDERLAAGRPIEETVAAALAGGADVIQLRDKSAAPPRIEELVRRLLGPVRAAGAALVVNDHWEIAREQGADGVHLGPGDASVAKVRAACPRPFRIGASARTAAIAGRARAEGADYLGTGPVYGTTSKREAPPAIGLARIGEVARIGLPVVGIGGITAENAADVIRAGASGVAVLSYVMTAHDVENAVRSVRRAIDSSVPPSGTTPR